MEKKQAKITNLMVNRDGVAARTDGPSRWTWGPEKVYHWTVTFVAFSYIMWRFATNEEKTFLVDQMHGAFRESPYGLPQKQDMTNWGWRTTTYVVTTMWKWYLLHPVLGRATAYIAPSLVPVFYAAYSSLFVTFSFGWEVTLLFLGQHAAFYAAAASHFPSLCYVAAIVIHCQKFVLPYDPFEYMYPRYGLMPYRAAFVAFHWNLMRGLSFSLDFVRAKRQKHSDENKSRWPPYWQSLAYFIYLPTMYLGPPQNYDDFVAELNKTRAPCTPRVIAGAIGRLLRSGAHFFLMELLGHFLYSSAMSEWPWIGERLDLFSLVGYALSLLFLFYMRYRFTYGFAGALANAEGVEVPPHSPCIAIMHRCSHFWRYFDRGMHKWIRRYIYEPVVAGRRRAFRLVLGTAVAFTFTWVWHSMYMHDGIWCALSVLGIALEVITMEARKWTPIKNFEGRYLASAERMRVAKAFLGSPHFLLTICACIFHLAELEVCLIICRRVLTGFPFPIVPILVVLYSACHVALDVAEWEASAIAKQKQASS
ncbi:protein-cysteine N-palmitoyltransferase Rasp isoform X7 [Dermacentor silvarum]|uniref:protein-cysteine N-palmitoyltransferase Rasp isoform X5 n=1 Tax=Dermacentor silvarum TaxID=543639 RepID=UPI002101649D|nr:protein-cysteine N-palmitoyltransferase Rasp isoform X5 [Dermacentor silvarum]XP_049526739.1 protein-cysteine N-palmitoyltransferase Rasp isoform X6 [Dermacentor silvarum]XP_049526740.1 protein-cysteine N-palmitoyltransferase Rasp isoform X7 [Dermacentor silvarum]